MADFWNAAKGVLGVVAPTLATAVGGPFAGVATRAIIGALGLAPDTKPEDVAATVAGATPEQLVALKQAELDFTAKMKQLDIDAAKLAYDDTANARAREVSVRDHTPAVLGYAITGGFFGLLGLMMFHALPPDSKDLLNIMLGALGTGFTLMLSYYYGSSSALKAAVK